MSAWPLAAWIVKRLLKNFHFDLEASSYAAILNNLNSNINNKLNSMFTFIEVESENQQYPDFQNSIGSICLIVDEISQL